jgi:hypothetical protein
MKGEGPQEAVPVRRSQGRRGPVAPRSRQAGQDADPVAPGEIRCSHQAEADHHRERRRQFEGEEIDRAQVRTFVRGHLGGLCDINGATMMLLQHPSVSGMADGTGRSGSTAWNNSGRWRLNFVTLKAEKNDDESDCDDRRQLQNVKANYGPRGEKINIRFDKDKRIFALEGIGSPSLAYRAAVAKAETVFIDLLDEFAASGRYVSDKPGKNYAVSSFANAEKGKAVGKPALEKAMHKLFDAKQIRLGLNPSVKPCKATPVILRVDPDPESGGANDGNGVLVGGRTHGRAGGI